MSWLHERADAAPSNFRDQLPSPSGSRGRLKAEAGHNIWKASDLR